MKILLIGFSTLRPHDEWFDGLIEAAWQLGHTPHLVPVVALKDGRAGINLGEIEKYAPWDLCILLLYQDFMHASGWQALKARCKKLVLWYQDGYDREWIDLEAAKRHLDWFFTVLRPAVEPYSRHIAPIRCGYLPLAARPMPFVQNPVYDTDVLWSGTRWSYEDNGKLHIWDRTAYLGILNQLWPIRFTPASGFYDHSNFPHVKSEYERARINLCINRIPKMAGTGIRIWNILEQSGFCLLQDYPDSKTLFPLGNCGIAKFTDPLDYYNKVKYFLNNDADRECRRYLGWKFVQEHGLWKHRLQTILETVI